MGEEGLVEETGCEELGVGFDEDVSTVEATEESDDGFKSLVGLALIESLESLLEFIITIAGNVMGSELALVHEVLERVVSVLLESDVIAERALNHLVHF